MNNEKQFVAVAVAIFVRVYIFAYTATNNFLNIIFDINLCFIIMHINAYIYILPKLGVYKNVFYNRLGQNCVKKRNFTP